jgi:hypothetical protein
LGVGFSLLKGTSSRGYRFEGAFSRLLQTKKSLSSAGEEFSIALEYGWRYFAFGGNMKLRKNAYCEHNEILDYAIDEKIFCETYGPSLSVFFLCSPM